MNKVMNKPKNEFIVYAHHHLRSEIDSGGRTLSVVMRKLAAEWKNLPQEKKDEYKVLYQKRLKEFDAWKEKQTVEVLEEYDNVVYYRRLKKKKCKARRRLQELSRDRPPMAVRGYTGGMNLFISQTKCEMTVP